STLGTMPKRMDMLRKAITSIVDKQLANEALGMINVKHIKIGGKKHYHYIGSLMNPPCTGGVIWNIVHE
ncbi:hypothetical protein KI387_028148, partial [Taxus chinensis]